MKVSKIAEACENVKDVKNVLKIASVLWNKDIISENSFIKVVKCLKSRREEIEHPKYGFIYSYNTSVAYILNIEANKWEVDGRMYIFITIRNHGRRLYEGLAARINYDMRIAGLGIKAGVVGTGDSLWIGYDDTEYIVGLKDENNSLRIKVLTK